MLLASSYVYPFALAGLCGIGLTTQWHSIDITVIVQVSDNSYPLITQWPYHCPYIYFYATVVHLFVLND
jgi:hypothetical protein